NCLYRILWFTIPKIWLLWFCRSAWVAIRAQNPISRDGPDLGVATRRADRDESLCALCRQRRALQARIGAMPVGASAARHGRPQIGADRWQCIAGEEVVELGHLVLLGRCR